MNNDRYHLPGWKLAAPLILVFNLLLFVYPADAYATSVPAVTATPSDAWDLTSADLRRSADLIRSELLVREQDSEVHTVVDTMPEVVGGLPELYNHIRYPREAVSRGIEGRVYLQFIVNENGGVEDPKVLRDIGGGCGEAAIDALGKIEFTPGIHEGRAVKVLYTLPVAFRLN